ncbi:MAG: universal stress protein [Sedimentisphaerales bacterium]|nr:universal stress protein [Sedimentisphaerales bacterium]
MSQLKKILYPTDFSEHSLCALPLAQEIAQCFDANLHCLHVVDEAYQFWLSAQEAAMPVVMPIEEMKQSAQEHMREFVSQHITFNPERLVWQVGIGRPFLEIIRYARQEEIDLIVIATHGHGALASMLLGSVTEKVVRKSPCPVLTVRHPEHKFEIP